MKDEEASAVFVAGKEEDCTTKEEQKSTVSDSSFILPPSSFCMPPSSFCELTTTLGMAAALTDGLTGNRTSGTSTSPSTAVCTRLGLLLPNTLVTAGAVTVMEPSSGFPGTLLGRGSRSNKKSLPWASLPPGKVQVFPEFASKLTAAGPSGASALTWKRINARLPAPHHPSPLGRGAGVRESGQHCGNR